MGAQCTAAFSPFKIPNLDQKNKYISLQNENQINNQNFEQFSRNIFGNNAQTLKSQRNLLITLFKQQKEKLFKDSKFQIKGERLSKMYDYKKRIFKLFVEQNKPGITVFQQSNVQFSYLSAILYFLCKHKLFLRKRVLLNPQINQKQIYAFRLFCNGQDHIVIVDDIIPAYQDKFLYSFIHGKQIWPCLLQKAWCKQIGTYEQSRGLSPEQCIQQITSVPSYSYQIHPQKIDLYETIFSFMKLGYFLCVVAKKQLDTLKPSQVFLIQQLNDQIIILSSPYTDFNYPTMKPQTKGNLQINFSKFVQLFDYLVVGFYKQSYVPTSIKFKAEKREQKYYELNVHKGEDVSIRFTQFYNGYLNDQQKGNYDYSPLASFQLYNQNGVLMNFCQGCDRIHAGVHSTYISNHIFHHLPSGTYYLRIEVDWEYPQHIKQGNIVVYSSQNNVKIQSLDTLKDLKQNIKRLHAMSLGLPNTVIIPCQAEQYELRYLQKKNNVLISVQNKNTQDLLRLELDFSQSQNFRIKYEKLQSHKKVILNLAPKETKFIQVLPQQIRKQFKIEPFSVKKLPAVQQ